MPQLKVATCSAFFSFACYYSEQTPSEPIFSILSLVAVCNTPLPGPQTLYPKSQMTTVLTQRTASLPDRPLTQHSASLWNEKKSVDFRKNARQSELKVHINYNVANVRHLRHKIKPCGWYNKRYPALFFYEQISPRACTSPAEFPPSLFFKTSKYECVLCIGGRGKKGECLTWSFAILIRISPQNSPISSCPNRSGSSVCDPRGQTGEVGCT